MFGLRSGRLGNDEIDDSLFEHRDISLLGGDDRFEIAHPPTRVRIGRRENLDRNRRGFERRFERIFGRIVGENVVDQRENVSVSATDSGANDALSNLEERLYAADVVHFSSPISAAGQPDS